jgi:ATP-dependent Clp protease ATP-binding subunit ClpC
VNIGLNLSSLRARKARTALIFDRIGGRGLLAAALIFGALAALVFWQDYDQRLGYSGLSAALFLLTLTIWYQRDLAHLPSPASAKSLEDILEQKLLAQFKKNSQVSPSLAWLAATSVWQGRFLCAHLLLSTDEISSILGGNANEMEPVWRAAYDLKTEHSAAELDGAALAAALLTAYPTTKEYLTRLNIDKEDVTRAYAWTARLSRFANQPKPHFGGIGRDWATGYTPTLDKFGQNISRRVEVGAAGHFHTLAHADILDSVVHNLTNGGSVALVGETGTGKTALVYALAQRLLEGRDPELLYHQIVSLNASLILADESDQLEKVMLSLFAEAVHAKNIIIFLDDARLFFETGPGALDLTQILLPILQHRQVKLITALTPHDLQSLKAKSDALTSQMPVVKINEPSTEVTLQVLEDSALTLEAREGILISFQAVSEAHRLSGHYLQELAYPGKAINLLEQAIPYVDNKIMTAESVQRAVEKTQGVRVTKAEGPESDILLNLEERIHARMINQEQAVKAVASALRRGRAGVANPNRPIGGFLFLGPTGVGKTELARSLAATYFGDARQMIRLDMSEYQRPEDVSRLLDSGGGKNSSLILSIREQPFSVVLLDELEKAHPNVLNLLLQILDEGQLTDQNGRPASFKNAIIIATSNAGSTEITGKVQAGDQLANFERPLIDKLIGQGIFKAELVNRFDEIVLFRPLNPNELLKVASLMLEEVNRNLEEQNVKVKLTDAALAKVVEAGYDPQFGARPMRRAIQKMVEDSVAQKILKGEARAGSEISLDVSDLSQA